MSALTRLVPGFIKRPIKDWLRLRTLRPVAEAVKKDYSRRTVTALREAWGNTGYSADVDFLMEAVRLARRTNAPVIECGSGVSTFLFAALGIPLISLEDDRSWADFCRHSIARCGLTSNVMHAPLISYGEWDWYQLPPDLPAGIGLVLCDGPPGTTRGGRAGLMAALRGHLAPQFTILMDDVDRPAEHTIAESWSRQYGLALDFIQSQTRGVAVLTKG